MPRIVRKKKNWKPRRSNRRRTRRMGRNPNKKLPLVMNYADRPENKSFSMYIERPFARIKQMRFKYSMVQALASTVSSAAFGVAKGFYLNSLWSPEISGGHQPYGFDQICAAALPYQRYKVNGVKVKLTFYGLRGGDTADDLKAVYGACLVNNQITTSTTAGAVLSFLEECPQSQVVRISNTGAQHGVITFYLPMHKAFNWGKQDYKREESNTTGPYNNNPASTVPMYVSIGCISAPLAQVTAYVQVDLTFYAELYARTVLAQS